MIKSSLLIYYVPCFSYTMMLCLPTQSHKDFLLHFLLGVLFVWSFKFILCQEQVCFGVYIFLIQHSCCLKNFVLTIELSGHLCWPCVCASLLHLVGLFVYSCSKSRLFRLLPAFQELFSSSWRCHFTGANGFAIPGL